MIVTRHIYHRVRDKCAKSKHRRHAVITDPEQEELVSNGEGPMTQSGSHDYLSFMKETGRLEDVNTYQPSNSWSSRSEQNSNSSGSMHSVNSTSSPDNSRDDYEQIEERQSISLTERHAHSSSKRAYSNRRAMGGWRGGEGGKATYSKEGE